MTSGRGGFRPGDERRGGAGQRPGGPGGGPAPRGAPAASVDSEAIKKVIQQDDPETLVKLAEIHGRALFQAGLATAQIRGLFSSVRAMEGRWLTKDGEAAAARDLILLRPKLAYQAARHREVKLLEQMLRPALDAVGRESTRFRRFVDYFEAILAYHKAAGGRD